MLKDLSVSAAVMGLIAALVGFASSFAITLQGLLAAGASTDQAASGLMVLSIAMGVSGVILSLMTRMPISVAWSTPGAALLITTGQVEGGFAAAVGAFIICAVLLLLTGLWSPLGRLVARIPISLANAMLAGVLFNLCLAPALAIEQFPLYTLMMIGAWLIAGRINKLLAVPAALLVFMLLLMFQFDGIAHTKVIAIQSIVMPELVRPHFNIAALTGIALPLYLVTMASQNIPGIAVLNVNGFHPKVGPLFSTTGAFSLLAAPFGGHAVNLAAITAALCAGADVHPNASRRYWSSIVGGCFYIVFGIFAGAVTSFVALAPTELLLALGGLALFGAFTASSVAAFNAVSDREASAITFFITASGISLLGISGAFWGLLAGAIVLALTRTAGE